MKGQAEERILVLLFAGCILIGMAVGFGCTAYGLSLQFSAFTPLKAAGWMAPQTIFDFLFTVALSFAPLALPTMLLALLGLTPFALPTGMLLLSWYGACLASYSFSVLVNGNAMTALYAFIAAALLLSMLRIALRAVSFSRHFRISSPRGLRATWYDLGLRCYTYCFLSSEATLFRLFFLWMLLCTIRRIVCS